MTSMQLEPQWMQLKCSTLSFIVTFLYNNTEIEYETYTIQAVSYRTLFFFSLRVMAHMLCNWSITYGTDLVPS